MVKILFQNRNDKQSKKEEKFNFHKGYNGIPKTLYYNDIIEMLSSDIHEKMIEALFWSIIKHSSNNENELALIKRVIDIIINHKNFNKKILKDFIKSQISDPLGENYINGMKKGDDLDLNQLKKYIIEQKILSIDEVIELTTLPYISLWDVFFDHIFQYNKPEEKKIILNFINTRLIRFHKFPVIKYKIERYINS